MPRYLVKAAHRETGAEVDVPVDAMTPALAQAFVNSLGLLAGQVQLHGADDAAAPTAPNNPAVEDSEDAAAQPSDDDALLLAERQSQIANDPREQRLTAVMIGGPIAFILPLVAYFVIVALLGDPAEESSAAQYGGSTGIDKAAMAIGIATFVGLGWGVVKWWKRSCVPCPKCGKRRLGFLDTAPVRQEVGARLVNQTEYSRSEIRRFGNIGFPDYVVTTPTERTVVQQVVRRLERDRFQCKDCGEICPRLVVREYT